METNLLRNIGLILLAFTVLGLTSCKGKQQDTVRFDRELYKPDYASGFSILGSKGRKSVVIESSNPWQGADSVSTRLLILRGEEEVPAGFIGQVMRGDARRIVAMSSTHIAMLDALGETDRVVGASVLPYVTNPRIRARRDSIGDVGYEGNVNYELLLSLNPDIVLLYGVNGANPMVGKLEELGIPYMYVGDYLEQSPLGKAEWMVALAEVTGDRRKGEQAFSEIPGRYVALKRLVAENGEAAPKVMIGAPVGDKWFMPSTESYVARLVADAGGDYIYRRNTGNASAPIDLEEAYQLVSEADVWLNTGNANSLDELASACPKFTDTEVFRSGKAYNNTATSVSGGGNDIFESGVIRPDVVLRDLIRILHPALAGDSLVYYRHLK